MLTEDLRPCFVKAYDAQNTAVPTTQIERKVHAESYSIGMPHFEGSIASGLCLVGKRTALQGLFHLLKDSLLFIG